jgi:hypothetical protein
MTKPRIFCFGSNTKGWHSKGAALFALNERGAIRYQAEGLQGTSYGIPTRKPRFATGAALVTLSLEEIYQNILRFIDFSIENSQLDYEMTRIACGHGGKKDSEIAPMFRTAPVHVLLPEEWKAYV